MFAVGVLLASGSSYRERALLPFGGEGDTGLLAREISDSGVSDLVSLEEPDAARFIGTLVRSGTNRPGARRRNIAPRPAARPVTSPTTGSSPAAPALANAAPTGNGSGSGSIPGIVNTAPIGGGVGGGGGSGGAPGAGNIGSSSVPGIGGNGGSPITTVALADPLDDSGPTTPGTPTVVTPTTPTVTSPVPEPETWFLFILGLFASGALLRRQKRQPVAIQQDRAASADGIKTDHGLV